jgi:hypothetical protein
MINEDSINHTWQSEINTGTTMAKYLCPLKTSIEGGQPWAALFALPVVVWDKKPSLLVGEPDNSHELNRKTFLYHVTEEFGKGSQNGRRHRGRERQRRQHCFWNASISGHWCTNDAGK